MQWKKQKIVLEDGTTTEAQAPVIISASCLTILYFRFEEME